MTLDQVKELFDKLKKCALITSHQSFVDFKKSLESSSSLPADFTEASRIDNPDICSMSQVIKSYSESVTAVCVADNLDDGSPNNKEDNIASKLSAYNLASPAAVRDFETSLIYSVFEETDNNNFDMLIHQGNKDELLKVLDFLAKAKNKLDLSAHIKELAKLLELDVEDKIINMNTSNFYRMLAQRDGGIENYRKEYTDAEVTALTTSSTAVPPYNATGIQVLNEYDPDGVIAELSNNLSISVGANRNLNLRAILSTIREMDPKTLSPSDIASLSSIQEAINLKLAESDAVKSQPQGAIGNELDELHAELQNQAVEQGLHEKLRAEANELDRNVKITQLHGFFPHENIEQAASLCKKFPYADFSNPDETSNVCLKLLSLAGMYNEEENPDEQTTNNKLDIAKEFLNAAYREIKDMILQELLNKALVDREVLRALRGPDINIEDNEFLKHLRQRLQDTIREQYSWAVELMNSTSNYDLACLLNQYDIESESGSEKDSNEYVYSDDDEYPTSDGEQSFDQDTKRQKVTEDHTQAEVLGVLSDIVNQIEALLSEESRTAMLPQFGSKDGSPMGLPIDYVSDNDKLPNPNTSKPSPGAM